MKLLLFLSFDPVRSVQIFWIPVWFHFRLQNDFCEIDFRLWVTEFWNSGYVWSGIRREKSVSIFEKKVYLSFATKSKIDVDCRWRERNFFHKKKYFLHLLAAIIALLTKRKTFRLFFCFVFGSFQLTLHCWINNNNSCGTC